MLEEYEPPPGFQRANFRSDDTAGEFAAESLGPALQKKDKALWMVKLPAGLDPKELEGLKLPLSAHTGKQASTIARFTAGKDNVEYTVVPVPLQEGQAQPPPGAEMPSFDIFLPTQSKRGEMARVPRPSHYFTVALAPPPVASDPPAEAVLPIEISKEEARKIKLAQEARKTRHVQPEHKLRGYFSPAGATAVSKKLDKAWSKTQQVDLDDEAQNELRRLLSGEQQRDLRAQFVAAVGSQPIDVAEEQIQADRIEAANEDVTMEDGAISGPAGGQFETNDPSVPEPPKQEAKEEEPLAVEAGEADADESKRKHRSSKDKEHKSKDKKRRSSSSKHSSKEKDEESREHKHSSHDKDKSKKRRSSEGKDERKSKREKKE